MKISPSAWYTEKSFLLAFVGGCTNFVGYIYLFHTLIGLMTVNTMLGVMGLINKSYDSVPVYHLTIVSIFICLVFLYQLCFHKISFLVKLPPTILIRFHLSIATLLFLVFLILGHLWLHADNLTIANLHAIIVVSIGSLSMYIQSMVVKLKSSFPANTSIMTGNYINLANALVDLAVSNQSKQQTLAKIKYYLLIHGHFILGLIVTGLLGYKLDFLALLIPFIVLLDILFNYK